MQVLVARGQQRSCCPLSVFACTIQANKLHLYAPVRINRGTYFHTAASRFPVVQRVKASNNSLVSAAAVLIFISLLPLTFLPFILSILSLPASFIDE